MMRTIALASVALPLAACAPPDDAPTTDDILGTDVEMVIEGMDLYVTREGVRRVRLLADTAEFIGEGEVRMTPVQLVFYDEIGNELSTVNGDQGTYNERTDDMEARGNVVAIDRREDQRIETSVLRYTSVEDRLFGDEPFTLYRDNGRTEVQGSRFETDPGLASVLMFDSSGRTEQAPRTRVAPPPQNAVVEDSAIVSDPPPDSLTAPPDTVTAPPDTASAPPDTVSTRR